MLCDKFKSLPGPGGVLNQDSYHVWLLTLYVEALAERRQKEAKESESEARAASRRR